MGRLTRQERAVGVGGGLLLGAAVGLIGQVLSYGLAVDLALCVIFAAGWGAYLATRGGGPR